MPAEALAGLRNLFVTLHYGQFILAGCKPLYPVRAVHIDRDPETGIPFPIKNVAVLHGLAS